MFKCQMPKCKNSCDKIFRKSGFFHGVFLKNITIKTCKYHKKAEIDAALNRMGERASALNQMVNPYNF